MTTPIVFIIFNRPQHTKKVFECIRQAKPEKLLIIADGPRNNQEKILCDETREIVEQINWPCSVYKKYNDENIGCRINISSGITWAFSIVDQAIILEDDCLPNLSFFKFCEELLEKYSDNEKIMHISGNFFQQTNKKFNSADSYYFSILPHIWGWATWKRAWEKYDVDINAWPQLKSSGLIKKILSSPAVYEYWETVWDDYYNKKIDSWDGQWTLACLKNEGLCINPCVNLVSNIGFDSNATRTTNNKSIFANINRTELYFPLSHPKEIRANILADNFTWRQNFGINTRFRQKILGPIRRYWPKAYSFVRNLFPKKF